MYELNMTLSKLIDWHIYRGARLSSNGKLYDIQIYVHIQLISHTSWTSDPKAISLWVGAHPMLMLYHVFRTLAHCAIVLEFHIRIFFTRNLFFLFFSFFFFWHLCHTCGSCLLPLVLLMCCSVCRCQLYRALLRGMVG